MNSNIQGNNETFNKQIIKIIITKAIKCSEPTLNLVNSFIQAIYSEDESSLKKLSAKGLPDDIPMLRSLIWKINLNYLSINNEEWESTLESQRKTYNNYKEIFITKLKEEVKLFKDFNTKSPTEKRQIEKNTNKKLLENIAKDVNRTHIQVSFFCQPVNKNIKLSENEIKEMLEKRRNCILHDIEDIYKVNINETHADVIARMLFIYCKFSPDISYVQGMNELIAPIYYCYSYGKLNEDEDENEKNIEADTFWSFYLLMQKLKCLFDREEDNSDKGLWGKIYKLKSLVSIIDKKLSEHLDNCKFDFSCFVIRWFTLLFSQEFRLNDILRLWDYLFCDGNLFKNIYYVTLAILEMKKNVLLVKNLPGIIEELQNLLDLEIESVIGNAMLLENHYHSKISSIINED